MLSSSPLPLAGLFACVAGPMILTMVKAFGVSPTLDPKSHYVSVFETVKALALCSGQGPKTGGGHKPIRILIPQVYLRSCLGYQFIKSLRKYKL